MININKNHNSSLLNSCKALYDYISYVEKVKSNIKSGMNKDSAVDNAVDFAIKNDLLNGFFKVQKSEVLGMSLTEFDEEEFVRNRREEGRIEGIAIGEQRGLLHGAKQAKLETAKNLFAMNILSKEQIASATGLTLEQIEQLQSETAL